MTLSSRQVMIIKKKSTRTNISNEKQTERRIHIEIVEVKGKVTPPVPAPRTIEPHMDVSAA